MSYHIKNGIDRRLASLANDIKTNLTSILLLVYCVSKKEAAIAVVTNKGESSSKRQWILFFVKGSITERQKGEAKRVKLFQRSSQNLELASCLQFAGTLFHTSVTVYNLQIKHRHPWKDHRFFLITLLNIYQVLFTKKEIFFPLLFFIPWFKSFLLNSKTFKPLNHPVESRYNVSHA